MSANEAQVGGDHYQSSYQLWDFVEANSVGFLEACIAKYVIRHRKKNGREDLEKALHCALKLIELSYGSRVPRNDGVSAELVVDFCYANQLNFPEARICFLVFGNWVVEDLVEVCTHIEKLIQLSYSPDEAQASYEVG